MEAVDAAAEKESKEEPQKPTAAGDDGTHADESPSSATVGSATKEKDEEQVKEAKEEVKEVKQEGQEVKEGVKEEKAEKEERQEEEETAEKEEAVAQTAMGVADV